MIASGRRRVGGGLHMEVIAAVLVVVAGVFYPLGILLLKQNPYTLIISKHFSLLLVAKSLLLL